MATTNGLAATARRLSCIHDADVYGTQVAPSEDRVGATATFALRTLGLRVPHRAWWQSWSVRLIALRLHTTQRGLTMTDPFEPLSATELAARLGESSPGNVRSLEDSGKLFSILPPDALADRAYPAFQAWANIAGTPLHRILIALGDAGGGSPYMFFSCSSPELFGLCPVEALSGELLRARSLDPRGHDLLRSEFELRLDAVYGAARACATDRSA